MIVRNILLTLLLSISIVSCQKKAQILIDGSSTVYPITEAVAEEFRKVQSNVNVTVGVSGTGGGFKKFCNSEIDISDASRPIKSSEIELCKKNNTRYQEIPVAWDGLAIVVHKNNNFVDKLTVLELKKLFQSKNAAKTWKEIRSDWPDETLKIYSPGQDSGTFDYFVETILGNKEKMRSDATYSEDDNVLVRGIAGDKNSIGFFGLAYYEENKESLKLVPVVNPETNKEVTPTLETVKNRTYAPLSRPIFIYVSKKAASNPDIKNLVNFYLENAGKLSQDVGYIPLEDVDYKASIAKFATFQ